MFCYINVTRVTVPHSLKFGQHLDDVVTGREALVWNICFVISICVRFLEPSLVRHNEAVFAFHDILWVCNAPLRHRMSGAWEKLDLAFSYPRSLWKVFSCWGLWLSVRRLDDQSHGLSSCAGAGVRTCFKSFKSRCETVDPAKLPLCQVLRRHVVCLNENGKVRLVEVRMILWRPELGAAYSALMQLGVRYERRMNPLCHWRVPCLE